MKASKKPLFQSLLTEIFQDAKFPFWASLCIHILSNFQIIYLILQPTLNPDSEIRLKVLIPIRTITSYSVGFNIFDPPGSQTLIKAIWFILCLYLLGLALLILYNGIRCYMTKSSVQALNVLKLGYFLHSKVLFCPIQYFIVWVATSYDDCDLMRGYNSVQCEIPYFVLSLVLACLNLLMCFFKELFHLDQKKSKDAFAVKNNLFYQTVLLHKSVLIIFIMTLGEVKILLSIFNCIFPLIYCGNILSSFPFYNVFFLKLNMIFSTIHFTLGLILMIASFGTNQAYSEVIIVVLSIMLIRIFLGYINKCLERIMRLEFKTPQEAAHILVLLKESTDRYSTIAKRDDKYHARSFYLYGLLHHYNVNVDNLKDFCKMEEYDFQLYTEVVQKLNEMLKVYPKSELLILLLAQIYLKKLRNVAKAISLLTHFEAGGLSIRAYNEVRNIYSKLEHLYCKINTEDELELLKYFQQRDNANMLKEMIQNEISKHLRLWKELTQESTNVKLVVDMAEEIELEHRRCVKHWNQVQKALDKNFLTPILMYGAYLDTIRKNAHDAKKLMRNYYELKRNKATGKNHFSPFSDNAAVILGSIEVENAGVVKDASSSVQTLFNISKQKLIGQRVEMLLPRPIAKKHETMIKRFARLNRHELNRQFDTYGKTTDGYLFPVEIKAKIYPYIHQGLNVISLIRKLRDREVLLIIDQNGIIVECSNELYDILNLTKKDLDIVKGIDLCPDLKELENAYQVLYGIRNDWTSLYRDETRFSITEDRSDDRKLGILELKKTDSAGKEKSQFGERRTSEMAISFNDTKSSLQFVKPIKMSSFNVKQPKSLHPISHLRRSSFENVIQKMNSEQVLVQMRHSAEEICKNYRKGAKVSFYPKTRGQEMFRDKIEFKIVVLPYLLEGELLKVIKFKNIYFDESTNFQKQNTLVSLAGNQKESSEPVVKDQFAENFPEASERILKPADEHVVEAKIIVAKEHTHNQSSANKNLSKLEKLQKILVKDLDHDSFRQTIVVEEENVFDKFNAKGMKDDATSLNYSHKQIRVGKVLYELFRKSALRSVTKAAVLIVYLAMITVLLLTSLDYLFSLKSFNQMKDGALMINTASYRIREALLAWEFDLVMYSRAVQLRPITPIIQTAIERITSSSERMLKRNKELQDQLQESGKIELINTFFDNSVALWEPGTNKIFNSGFVNTFTATTLIAQKNLFVARFNKSIYLLNGREEILFSINNTCNDLLIKYEEQVSHAEKIINDIIQTNETLILVLLGLELVALTFVAFSLFLVARVIINSYKKLFKVLTRVNPEHLSQRIAELTTMYECLNKNIEMKDFSIKFEGFSEINNKAAKKNVKQKTNPKHIEEKFSLKNLVLRVTKVLLWGLSPIFLICGVFLVSYFTANTTFISLQLDTQRLSIAHQLGYTFDMILGTFYFNIIFQNNTDYLVRYKSPSIELDNSLQFLSVANERLLSVLAEPKEGIKDPILEEFLKTNICRFLDQSLETFCILSTKGKTLGLLGLNTKYYQTNFYWAAQYKANPTFSYASQILVPYVGQIENDNEVIPKAYEFLRTYLLKVFNDRVEAQRVQGLMVFLIVLGSLLASTFVIQTITLKKFKLIDIGIRRVLKVVPFHIIQENRLFTLYLKAEFAKELESVKQFV